jgi:hypothetical protein
MLPEIWHKPNLRRRELPDRCAELPQRHRLRDPEILAKPPILPGCYILVAIVADFCSCVAVSVARGRPACGRAADFLGERRSCGGKG